MPRIARVRRRPRRAKAPPVSNLTLSIGGRDYTVACAPGEEAHVTGLGRIIDEKLESMPATVAHSETRSLLFAALLLADEVFEARAAVDAQPEGDAEGDADSDAEAAEKNAHLARVARRLENLATHLEGGASSA